VFDPVERLPIVVCPGCQGVSVRRRDPMVAGFRAARRGVRAGVLVAVQWTVICALTAAGVWLVSDAATLASTQFGRNPLHVLVLTPGLLRPDAQGPDLLVNAVLLLMAAGFAGAWARSALAHLPAIGVWLVWSAGVAAIATLPGWIYVMSNALPDPPRPAWGSLRTARSISEHLTMAMLFAVFFAMGMPLGSSVRALWASAKRERRAALRRNRRALRENR
tara:strand:+ start:4960 stop:5619 length:660 start_codon:yes stop_codon:yes gene_type:complete